MKEIMEMTKKMAMEFFNGHWRKILRTMGE